MFSPSLPWWEFPARAALVYAALLVMVRLSGKRTVGQFTPFDLLVVMLLSESVSNALGGGDESVAGGLMAAASLIVLNGVVAIASARSRRVERLVEGDAVLIGRDGRLYDEVLRRHRVGAGDIARALREADCEVHELRLAFLEADGSISVQKRSAPTG